MLIWYNWQYDMKKKDEEKSMDVELQKLVSDMIKSANGGTGLFSQNHQANGVERRNASQIALMTTPPNDATSFTRDSDYRSVMT